MGTVYTVLTSDGSEIALKVPQSTKQNFNETNLYFLEEIQLMLHLEHPNIVTVKEFILEYDEEQKQLMKALAI